MIADSECGLFGVAKIDGDGTVSLQIVTRRNGLTRAHETLCFEKSHPHYRVVLEQVGPIEVGEEKVIRPAI